MTPAPPRPLGPTSIGLDDPWLPAVAVLPTFLVAFATLLLACDDHAVAPIWPANAVILALLLQTGVRSWSRSLMAGACGFLFAGLIVGCLTVTSALLSVSNLFEVIVCAGLVRAVTRAPLDIRRAKPLATFMVAALVAPACSALCAAALLSERRGEPFGQTFRAWYGGDVLGLLVVTPLLLLALEIVRSGRRR